MAGFENIATYQPTFLYESLWDVGVALLLIWAARRFLLTGDRIFALYVAAYGVGRFIIESLRIDFAHHFLGLRVNQWMAVLIFVGGAIYLYRTRGKVGPDVIEQPVPAMASPAAAPTGLVPGDTDSPETGADSTDGAEAAGVADTDLLAAETEEATQHP